MTTKSNSSDAQSTSLPLTADHIAQAYERIRMHIRETPLLHVPAYSERTGAHVYFKLENRQHTGSFKLRGALNKILALTGRREIVTASTGNHGLGVAHALQITGGAGTIFIPENAAPAKVAALRQYPVTLKMYGYDSLTTELYAKHAAQEHHAEWISPYNDPEIIAGQGTTGLEITRQLADIRAIYVTIGGGGLMSGIATWYAAHAPGADLIGCLPEHSPEMQLSIAAGHIVQMESPLPTLSDGSAGGLEEGAITFPICKTLVHRYLLVSEEQIAAAIRTTWEETGERIEGAAGVAIAAMAVEAHRYAGGNVVAVICGGNIDERTFVQITSGHR